MQKLVQFFVQMKVQIALRVVQKMVQIALGVVQKMVQIALGVVQNVVQTRCNLHMFLHLHGAKSGANEVQFAHVFAPSWCKNGAHEFQISMLCTNDMKYICLYFRNVKTSNGATYGCRWLFVSRTCAKMTIDQCANQTQQGFRCFFESTSSERLTVALCGKSDPPKTTCSILCSSVPMLTIVD